MLPSDNKLIFIARPCAQR